MFLSTQQANPEIPLKSPFNEYWKLYFRILKSFLRGKNVSWNWKSFHIVRNTENLRNWVFQNTTAPLLLKHMCSHKKLKFIEVSVLTRLSFPIESIVAAVRMYWTRLALQMKRNNTTALLCVSYMFKGLCALWKLVMAGEIR